MDTFLFFMNAGEKMQLMTEYEKLIVPCSNAEEKIKNRLGLSTYNQIVSWVKSSSLDLELALNFTANLIDREFSSREEHIDFLNSLMPELEGDKAILAYITGMLYASLGLLKGSVGKE